MTARWLWAVGLLFVAICAAGCSKRESSSQINDSCDRFPGLCESGDLLLQVGRAMDEAGAYRLTVNQENFVLPRWGGSDGGTVDVDLNSGDAVANLHRTGDGNYAIVLRDGETYFKRETCPNWAKIQDGAQVLAPFVITSDEIAHSKLIKILPSSTSAATGVARLDLEGVGEVTLEMEQHSLLPVRITSETLTSNGKPLEWTFSNWGDQVKVPPVSGDRLSGPGGNPC